MQLHSGLPCSAPGIEGQKLSPDTESPSMEMYHSLGLQASGRKVAGSPRVLSLVSSLVERSVEKSERLLELAQRKDTLTIFHGLRAPGLTVCQYIDRIYKCFGCSASCFVIAVIYVDRFLRNTEVLLTSLNVHRLLITSMTIAAKFMDDAFFNNAYYAKVGGVSTSELNRLELKFLFGIDFRLQVSLETFRCWCLMLEKEPAASEGILVPIEWPKQVRPFDKAKEVSWTEIDESPTCVPPLAG
ncbi:hypothetical protein MLD38_025075 [Melastoma candidum]|uniref:Uncharacterized protein n=1 Tax=Melastoma candidum TaxID=119954 RepID=A0ACB9NV76_9MYRT|nr:hypothetical protein MLD38_025075 [Melastoma candidum]